ncbi:hypothetical protein C408_0713 [Vibrio diabolicus E0666]|uniref:Uncharacterized protein n=2 Tax=Vibrio harveyi group TaxID=717610 RepID=A0A2I3C8Y6_VIBAX|nr:hypothetical protein VEA_002757 [Vibrio antiquarius]AGV17250.1 hypothetical protein N646_1417 [Vibrio alginolyticus NBRC 15630 = ATCC 17749]EMD80964.1 hypothetical protein C408_0713 [Vibrio diabolicus E0666]
MFIVFFSVVKVVFLYQFFAAKMANVATGRKAESLCNILAKYAPSWS